MTCSSSDKRQIWPKRWDGCEALDRGCDRRASGVGNGRWRSWKRVCRRFEERRSPLQVWRQFVNRQKFKLNFVNWDGECSQATLNFLNCQTVRVKARAVYERKFCVHGEARARQPTLSATFLCITSFYCLSSDSPTDCSLEPSKWTSLPTSQMLLWERTKRWKTVFVPAS